MSRKVAAVLRNSMLSNAVKSLVALSKRPFQSHQSHGYLSPSRRRSMQNKPVQNRPVQTRPVQIRPVQIRPVRITALAAAGLTVLALTGCVPDTVSPTPSAIPTQMGPSAPTSSPTSSPTGGATTAPPEAGGTPVSVTCDHLVSPDEMYDFNPNYGTAPGYAPGELASVLVADGGVACGWANQTSGDAVEIAVASPDPATLDRQKGEALAGGSSVGGFSGEAFFHRDGEVGEVQVFTGTHWVVARSVAFVEAGDAVALTNAALASLG